MKRALLSLFLLILLLFSSVSAEDWSVTVAKVDKSVVRVTGQYVTEFPDGTKSIEESTCTGWSINQAQGYFMTAFHCLTPDKKNMFINGEEAKVVDSWEAFDLVLLGSAKFHLTPLQPTTKPILKGQPIGALGFGEALGDTMFRAGYVSNPSVNDFNAPPYMFPGDLFLIMDNPPVPGMSGGPIFNLDGDVVSIVQLGGDGMGLSRPVSVLKATAGKYWSK